MVGQMEMQTSSVIIILLVRVASLANLFPQRAVLQGLLAQDVKHEILSVVVPLFDIDLAEASTSCHRSMQVNAPMLQAIP